MHISIPSRSGTPTKGFRTPRTPGSPGKLDVFQPRRRIHIIRLLAITLTIVLCYILATRGPETSTWVPTAVQDKIDNYRDHAADAAMGQGKKAQDYETEHEYPEEDRWVDDGITEEPASHVSDKNSAPASSGKPHKSNKKPKPKPKEMKHTEDRIGGDEEAEYEELKSSQEDNVEPHLEEGSDFVAPSDEDEKAAVEPSHHTSSHPFVAHNIGSGEKYSFREALRDVLRMEPDEIYIRDLLRPLEGGGQERLKELGVRTRAFYKFFTVWEALHVLADEKLTYVRDDIIQYLEYAPEEELAGVSNMERGDIVRAYERYRHFLNRLSGLLFPYTNPYFSDHMTLHSHFRNGGRGIVMSGNDKQARYVLTSLESIRRLGCNLPVEIMYLGENDLNDDWRMRLESIPGVVTRDLSQMVSDDGWELKGWASKAFALLMSSFREVIYLDADAMFMVNPEDLYEDPGYAETGALFFRDRVFAPSSRKQWLKDILPKPISKKAQTSRYWTGESREQMESGCLVVDKWRHFVALLTVTRMNGPDRDDDPKTGAKGVYSLFYGDKETFWLGWELAGDTDYWFHPGPTGNMGMVSEHFYYHLVNGQVEKIENYKPPMSDDLIKPPMSDDLIAPDHKTPMSDDIIPPKAEDKPKDPSPETDKATAKEGEHTKRDNQKDTEVHEQFIINSPQLLHLGLDNRPIWFNGWILDDKFEDTTKNIPVSTWDVYMSEIKNTGEAPEWRIGAHNMATLRGTHTYKFSDSERKVLQMIVQIAKDNGSIRGEQVMTADQIESVRD